MNNFTSDTLLIAIITGVGYLSAFAYKFAYLSHFDVPVFFVEINLSTILAITSVEFFVMLYLALFINDARSWEIKNNLLNLIKNYGHLIFSFIVTSVLAYLYVYSSADIILFPPMLLILICLFILFIIRQKELTKGTRKHKPNILLSESRKILGPLLFQCILISILAVMACYVAGGFNARNSTKYLVSNTNPSIFLISSYQDSFIVATYIKDKKTFDNITLINKDQISDKNMTFSDMEIGPLNSKDNLRWKEYRKSIYSWFSQYFHKTKANAL